MWGDLAAAPRWNHASLPRSDHEVFNVDSDEDASVALALVDAGFEPVPGVASHRQLLERTRQVAAQDRPVEDRQPLEELLDALLDIATADAAENELEALTEFSVRAVDYARHNPRPSWLPSVRDDTELLNAFADAVEEWPLPDGTGAAAPAEAVEAFGLADVRDRLLEAARRAGGVSGRLAGRAFTAALRTPAHRAGAIFLGDVVVYLNKRGTRETPGEIVTVVADAMARGQAAVKSTADPKLVVVAHSMGGNIVYDVLTHFRPELRVDVLVTVGSQVAFLEELGQFRSSPEEPPADPSTDRLPRPKNVTRWINVFDLNDVLGFAAGRVYDGVEDFAYSTGEGAVKAHGAYFSLPSFHDRLRERLRESW